MRPTFGALALLLSVLLLSVGCSCSRDHVDDADGGARDGSLDGSLEDGATGDAHLDADIDGGPPDPTTCEGFAAAICARYEACFAENIWLFGSRARCEDYVKLECEHEDTLERTGDLDAARVAYVEARSLSDCDWARDEGALELWARTRRPGTGGVGDACRSSLQCGDGVTADGRTVPLRCAVPSAQRYEPACDLAVCALPLGEGATDCGRLVHLCDTSLGLECIAFGTDPPECRYVIVLGDGDACPGDVPPSRCADDLVCGPMGVCERRRTQGESCDPSISQHCLASFSTYCDLESRTCTLLDTALEGEACGTETGDPTCSGFYECVEGTCVRSAIYRAYRGEPCESSHGCWSDLTCVDGVCAPEPCD